MPILLFLANMFGISIFRLVVYAAIFASVVTGALVIRQHYVNLGYQKALTAVKKQDDRAVAAADQVQQKTKACNDKTGFWDTISQSCVLDEESAK
jgi:hypothetical protein